MSSPINSCLFVPFIAGAIILLLSAAHLIRVLTCTYADTLAEEDIDGDSYDESGGEEDDMDLDFDGISDGDEDAFEEDDEGVDDVDLTESEIEAGEATLTRSRNLLRMLIARGR